MAFGENVRTLREKAGYTQAELANLLGVSQPVYCQYETGAKAPTVYTAVKLARRLGTTCEKLVEGNEERGHHEREKI